MQNSNKSTSGGGSSVAFIVNATYPCSCTVRINGKALSIDYCAMHKVAPDSLEVLRYYTSLHEKHRLRMPERNENEGKEWMRTLELARAILAKADGKGTR